MNGSEYDFDKVSLVGSVDRYCQLLHGVYESLPINSQEREALVLAARALLFCISRDDFHDYLSNSSLTHEQREHLERLGIDLDEG